MEALRLEASNATGYGMAASSFKLSEIQNPEHRDELRDLLNRTISALDTTVQIHLNGVPDYFPSEMREVITILVENYNLVYENLIAILIRLKGEDDKAEEPIRLKSPINLNITRDEIEEIMNKFKTDQLVIIRAILFDAANQINTCDSVTTRVSTRGHVPPALEGLIQRGIGLTEEARDIAVTAIRQITVWTTDIIRRRKTEEIREEIARVRDEAWKAHADKVIRPQEPLTMSARTHTAVAAGIMRVAAWLVPDQYLRGEIELTIDGKPRLGVIKDGIERTRQALGMIPVDGNALILRMLMARNKHIGTEDIDPRIWIDPQVEDLDIRLLEYGI